MKRLILVAILYIATLHCIAQVNLVNNPGFELLHNCPNGPYQLDSAIGWQRPMACGGSPDLFNFCCTNPAYCGIPSQSNFNSFQYPHSGKGYAGIETLYGGTTNMREYIQNKLIKKLFHAHIYCITIFVSLLDNSQAYITKLGSYFDDGSITATSSFGLIQVTPQVYNSTQPLNDTLNWIKIEGSFTASGDEEYITLGNFFDDNNSGLVIIGTPSNWYTYYYIDDVSVIDMDLPVHAGNDTIINQGDSVFIGRPSEVGLDEDCIWFVNGVPIDTIAGLWVKPDSTTTYVLQQTICGNVKYDTVTVIIKGDGIGEFGIGKKLRVYPNPAVDEFYIEYSGYDTGEGMVMEVYNIYGSLVKEVHVNNRSKIIISTRDMPSGIYYYQVKLGNNSVGKNKIMVIK